ncbi:MAG TPA: glycosyltransferase family 61 protein [Lacunisphaera sp.]|jgi:hypothetical protein
MKTPGYLPPPIHTEDLATIVARVGGALVVKANGMRVDYALPREASAELFEFLRPNAMAEIGSTFIARLPGGRIFGSGNVLSPDGKSIARDVSPDFGKPFNEHWLLSYGKMPPPVTVAGRTAVIATTLGNGYGHWLLEELPRLIALETDGCETLIAHAGASCQREAIALKSFSGNLINARRRDHYSCDELIVPSLGELTPETVALLNDFVTPLRDEDRTPSFGERIYISRTGAKRRHVTNEPRLWCALESRGFIKLHLEELTWTEQITAFHSAKVIIAPHGAGLANLVFCRPGTKIVELFHRSYVNPCYWQLASLQALDYRPLVSAGTEPLAQLLVANRLNITAEIAQVLAALDR